MNTFVLKFIWLEKSIGVAIDQFVGDRTTPVSDYYFWPQQDAWEEVQLFLEQKSWISQPQSIVLLNQITDVINFWQDNPKFKDMKQVRDRFPTSIFVGFD